MCLSSDPRHWGPTYHEVKTWREAVEKACELVGDPIDSLIFQFSSESRKFELDSEYRDTHGLLHDSYFYAWSENYVFVPEIRTQRGHYIGAYPRNPMEVLRFFQETHIARKREEQK